MMRRALYRFLLFLHPASFRRRFAALGTLPYRSIRR